MRRLTSVKPATYNIDSDYYSAVTGAESVTYGYNENGNVSTITTGSTVYNLSYDEFGNQQGVSIGSNDPMATYTYNDHNGKLNKITYANGLIVEYEYNSLELLSKIWYTVSTGRKYLAYEYKYNADGSLYQHIDCWEYVTTTYLYDSDGKLISCFVSDRSAEYADVFAVEYGYDDIGRIDNVVYDIYHATDYDSCDCTWGIIHTTFSSSYTYDTDGMPSYQEYDVALHNGTTDISRSISYYYDGLGRLTGVDHVNEASGSAGFSSYSEYGYESFIIDEEVDVSTFNVASYTSTVNGVATEYSYGYGFETKKYIEWIYKNNVDTSYSYDDLGQLKLEINSELEKRFEYTYDDAGNITRKYTKNYGASTGTTIQYQYTDSQWGDQLTKYDGVTITYDALGNPLSYYNGKNYEFSWNGRFLTGWTNGEGDYYNNSFSYSEDGKITRATLDCGRCSYYYDGDLLISIDSEFTRYYFFYDANGSPIGFATSASTMDGSWHYYWYEKNMQGDIIAVYGNDGTKHISYTYDAWGNFTITRHTTIPNSAADNPFTYRGYFYCHELGMYYLGTRWYDPAIGRFISPDSVMSGANGSLHGLNLYAYCFNNPVNMTDASGNWPEWIEAVAGVVNKMADSFVKSIEADVGTGVGLSGNFEVLGISAYRDSYIGFDDGMVVTGNRTVVGGKYKVGADVIFDHRVEENGRLVTDSVSPNDGILDMITYPDTSSYISISGPLLGVEIGADRFDVILSANFSFHFLLGVHANMSINLSEYVVRLFE